MAKKKGHVRTEEQASQVAALEWHFGLVMNPPSDRVGKEYLVRHIPKRYKLEGDSLVWYRISALDYVY